MPDLIRAVEDERRSRPQPEPAPVRASRLTEAATRAFAPELDAEQDARASLRALIERLGADEARRVLDGVG